MTDFLKKFSSPLGDGLVQNNLKSKTIIGKFSSPSGVGLVRNGCMGQGRLKNFRPRVGIGWFQLRMFTLTTKLRFSSPLGDGLVQEYGSARWGNTKEFSSPSGDGLVPLDLLKRFTTKNYFRPRLGMGWFLIYCFRTNCTQIFK